MIVEQSTCPPVLFIVFNRPGLARQVLARIREARPAQIFVAADGPRPNVANEWKLCQQTRDDVLSQIDWNCEIRTLFQQNNLGCGLGPLTAINWFFENVEEGIILEDDCLPADCFFPFCRQMLSHYRDDTRVVAISGTNIFQEWKKSSYAYFFSYYGGNWGWATWRRAWRENDYQMRLWGLGDNRKYIEYVLGDRTEAEGVGKWFDSVVGKESDIWDFQWFYSRLMNSGLTIVPAKNMISNLGFGAEATHTTKPGPLSNLPLYETAIPTPINPVVVVDRDFDKATAKAYGFLDRPLDSPTHSTSFLLRVASYLLLRSKTKKLARRILRKLYWFAFPTNAPAYNCIIGEGSRIYEKAQINNPSASKANITIGANTHIAGNLTVWANAGKIDIGNSSFVGEHSRIYSARYVRIGDRVQIAHGCNIFDSNIHSLDPIERQKEYMQNIKGGLVKLFGLEEEEVVIGDDAWLGACVIVLKGVTIGKGAIVGAGSVVTKDIPEYSVAVGNPARIVRSVDRNAQDLATSTAFNRTHP